MRAAIMPSGSCTPDWSSRMNSCGSRCKNLAIGRQRNGPSAVDRLLDFVAAYFTRSRAQADAAMAIDAAHVRSSDADDGMLNRRAGNVLRGLDRFLNRRHGLVELNDHALARTARFGHAVSAIAQTVVGDLRHERASLGAAHVNCR